ncbi:MAG TPA: DUF4384 domain-containing protein [Azospirillum sp.]|nr:DUF4384 domain-containing protein [Azospirillum sp.]
MRTHIRATLLVAAALGTLTPGIFRTAQAAEAVVVAATAPGYAPGQAVSEGAIVRLPEGGNLHVLFATGRALTIKGPYEGPLDSPPGKNGNRLTEMFSRQSLIQGEVGAARGVLPARSGGMLPAIDPSQPGSQCLPATGRSLLKRPADPALADLTLTDIGSSRRARVAWNNGEAERPWPDGLTPSDGRTVEVATSGGKRHRMILRVVDPSGDDAALAVRLAVAGCASQAAVLLQPVRDAVAPLDLFLTTDRGLYPTYRPGEPVRLMVQTNRDAHLACTVRDGRGAVRLLFPTSASAGSAIAGHAPLLLPGERMPVPMVATDDQEVRCFAAERELSDALPHTVGLVPLTTTETERLERTLAAGVGRVVMGQVILRVEAR